MSKSDPKSERDLIWVVQAASALSLGTLAGLLYSMKRVSPSLQFGFGLATLVAFGLAALTSLAFWHIVFSLSNAAEHSDAVPSAQQGTLRWRKLGLALLAVALAAGLVFAFIYPLKDFSTDKQSEISHGAFIALGFLGVLSLLFWRVVRYLERVK